jgi:hypothetical protein
MGLVSMGAPSVVGHEDFTCFCPAPVECGGCEQIADAEAALGLAYPA